MNWQRFKDERAKITATIFQDGRFSGLCDVLSCRRRSQQGPGYCEVHQRRWAARRNFYRLPYHLLLALFTKPDPTTPIIAEFCFDEKPPAMYSWK